MKFDSKPLSNPILHDIIKAYLVYDYQDIFSYCSTLPQIKHSRVFKPESPHWLKDARQEWFAGGIKYPADAVWRFATEHEFPSYYVVHEVKTGHYDIEMEMRKHYIHNNHVSFYIWAYRKYHQENKKVPYTFVKQLNIESLKNYISLKTIRLMEEWRRSE